MSIFAWVCVSSFLSAQDERSQAPGMGWGVDFMTPNGPIPRAKQHEPDTKDERELA